jgi:hypothetical protein
MRVFARLIFNPEDGDDALLRNVSSDTEYTVLYIPEDSNIVNLSCFYLTNCILFKGNSNMNLIIMSCPSS